MTAGLRFRMVTAQDGQEHVSTVVLGEDETTEQLDLEAHLHEATGWAVERISAGDYLVAVRAHRPGVRRYIFARSYDPMEDA